MLETSSLDVFMSKTSYLLVLDSGKAPLLNCYYLGKPLDITVSNPNPMIVNIKVLHGLTQW